MVFRPGRLGHFAPVSTFKQSHIFLLCLACPIGKILKQLPPQVAGAEIARGTERYEDAVFPRGCRQNNLVHITIALIWQIARKEASFLAYLVATARHCLKVRNAFSTKWRSLYNARS